MELSHCPHKFPHTQAPDNLAMHTSLTMPQSLSSSSCCQKHPPPASPPVKSPSPHMTHFRPCLKPLCWNPQLHKHTPSSETCGPWLGLLSSCLLMLWALMNQSDLVAYSVSGLRIRTVSLILYAWQCLAQGWSLGITVSELIKESSTYKENFSYSQ